ncbi:MAG: SDR family NAD(P)-dependent oxidoreductase, partial [Clostridia bacterium]|nr:SDR family NAD(P)-dependent oxidoreductase [Clostridia bacterium]
MISLKKALVTGSSRGIGAETARELSRRGFSVCINYNNSVKEAEDLAAELYCPAFRADVSDPEQVREMFAALGPFDLLVNNAGVAWGGLMADMTDTEWHRLFAVNVDGVFNCCREAIPYMVRQKSGCIVNLASILGVAGGSCEA